MAFTVTFPSSTPAPTLEQLSTWLLQEGEPHEREGSDAIALRALPVRFRVSSDVPMSAWLDITPDTPLIRLIDFLFSVSVHAGTDVRLAGVGEMTRPQLWSMLADEQDRCRIASALEQANQRGQRDEIAHRLWSLLAALAPGRDLRWDAQTERVVEMMEVGITGGISTEEASWLVENASAGDLVPRPVHGMWHVLAHRWMTDAFPALFESWGER